VGVYFDPQRNVMMFGFAGELPDGKEPVITDHDELDDIGWFSMDGLPSPMRTSLPYVLDDVAADRRGVSRTIPFT
jgi:NADH pyrophosphatase NudC (nudix superfamily)